MSAVFFFRRWMGLMLVGLALGTGLAQAAKGPTVAGVVAQNRILTKLESVVVAADLQDLLASKGPFTLFAPTDSAFAKLPIDFLDQLLTAGHQQQLQQLVFYHLVEGKKIAARDLITGSLLTFSGLALTLKKTKLGLIQVQGAKILRADIHCQNGVIHQIDTVLIPPGFNLTVAPTPAAMAATSAPGTNAPAASPPAAPPMSGTNAPPHSVSALPVNP